ncbi:uncharacterized protein Bfra_004799 [Botrytis fragariae]|uniref:Uncharacterized protein n=1 Tax=Botrytis fragariae TaxID=1964551 RepID=A0A8H6ATI3_9HELO|nr:uncharacterized protein Bfra_004799 [Botrytis fragariae]KAF5873342.1 hypothetical protein Bfra_004799 [Botrytis fragariae]
MAIIPIRVPIATNPQYTHNRSLFSPLPFNYSSTSVYNVGATRAAISSLLATRRFFITV